MIENDMNRTKKAVYVSLLIVALMASAFAIYRQLTTEDAKDSLASQVNNACSIDREEARIKGLNCEEAAQETPDPIVTTVTSIPPPIAIPVPGLTTFVEVPQAPVVVPVPSAVTFPPVTERVPFPGPTETRTETVTQTETVTMTQDAPPASTMTETQTSTVTETTCAAPLNLPC